MSTPTINPDSMAALKRMCLTAQTQRQLRDMLDRDCFADPAFRRQVEEVCGQLARDYAASRDAFVRLDALAKPADPALI